MLVLRYCCTSNYSCPARSNQNYRYKSQEYVLKIKNFTIIKVCMIVGTKGILLREGVYVKIRRWRILFRKCLTLYLNYLQPLIIIISFSLPSFTSFCSLLYVFNEFLISSTVMLVVFLLIYLNSQLMSQLTSQNLFFLFYISFISTLLFLLLSLSLFCCYFSS